MGLFLVMCGLAIYLAHYRTESQNILSHVQSILTKLPAPVVISDASGVIVYTNNAFGSTWIKNDSEMKGKRYIDCFMPDIQEGKAMRYYIELFGETPETVHELEFSPSAEAPKQKARLTCLGSGPNRVMITVFSVRALDSIVSTN
jgi:PAS domain-containing protein